MIPLLDMLNHKTGRSLVRSFATPSSFLKSFSDHDPDFPFVGLVADEGGLEAGDEIFDSYDDFGSTKVKREERATCVIEQYTTIYCTLYTVYFTLYIVHYTLHTVVCDVDCHQPCYYTPYIVHCTLYTVHCCM